MQTSPADNLKEALGAHAAARLARISGRARYQALRFLLRWQQTDLLLATLDRLLPHNAQLVSLYDLKARALLIEGRTDEAMGVMEQRLEIGTSVPAHILLAQIHLAQGDLKAARLLAETLVTENPDSPSVWALVGDIERAAGETQAAIGAYQRLNEIRAQGRSYLLRMMLLYQEQGDWVGASGYAVRLLYSASDESPLPVSHLKDLLALFQASGERRRQSELEATLQTRYQEELAQFRAILDSERAISPPRDAEERSQRTPTGSSHHAEEAAALATSLSEIPVSEEERRTISEAARKMFGFASLLPGQLETMACVLRGEDVLTILPTGGGKSLCYQLPALLDEDGTTLVISPLIALMKDQVDSLPAGLRGRATTINSSLDGDELRHRQEQVGYGAYRLVYAAPERLRQPPFLQALRGGDVRRMVIDEAHCVSVWGHDFRPDYLTVGEARQALGDPPLLAMTATAPLHVRRDIIDHLSSNESRKAQAHDLRIVASDVTRPNLQLEAFHAKDTHDKLQYLLAFCGSERGSGIVYADTRARCEELAALLNEYGIVAAHYHAGIEKRAEVQDDFMTGRTRVVVATVAFGLGIDKPDIRFIVHFRPPPSLEAYYQEAGRAGRDGEAARCLLMVSSGDRGTLTRRIHRDALTLDDLREVYGAVQRHLAPERVGRVATADLQRDLRCDNTRLRVALGFLGQAGLLKRGPDVPRAASVRLTAPLDAARRSGQSGSNDTLPPDLAAFCHAARLRPQQWLTIDLLRVAAEAGLPLADAERHLLTWAEQGWLSYSPAGRDLLLELPPAPDDAREHLASLLDRFAAIQEQRCDEIMAYAQTKACRHGHLNAYLGGRTITDCSSCDNCIPIAPPTAPNLPDEKEQIALVLSCLAANAWGWGRITLLRILRGDARARQSRNRRPLSARAQNDPTFGKLRFCSATHVRALIEVLEQEGFLHPRRLDHGGETLELTAKGQRALQDKDLLDPLISSPASPAGRERGENGGDVDENVLEALKAWRSEQAKTEGVPAYVIFHNSHLRAIAASMPRTTSDLSQVKGIGPKRLEAYGESLLELLADHQEDSPGEESSPPSVDAHAPKESAAPGEH